MLTLDIFISNRAYRIIRFIILFYVWNNFLHKALWQKLLTDRDRPMIVNT